MRKILMVTAFVAPLLLASCSREPASDIFNGEKAEMSLSVKYDGTRGYVSGTELFDGETPRTLYLSAYNTKTSKNLFVGFTYKRADDGTWKHYTHDVHDPFYWPLGAVVDFLAFSVGNSDAAVDMAGKAQWNYINASSEVKLDVVSNEMLKDDILYAANSECSVTAGTPQLYFRHAQAWVEFLIDSEVENIQLTCLELKNIFTAGYLRLRNTHGEAICDWDFTNLVRTNHKIFQETESVPTDPENPLVVSVLLPSQQVLADTEAEITFTVPNVEAGFTVKKRTITFSDKHSTWLTGNHYSYRIHLK